MIHIFSKYKEFIFLIFILLVGLYLRVYDIHVRTSFDADQEWLAFRAKELSKGDLPLLGPVTSIGSFSIGPGYVYLLSFAGIFTSNSPITGVYLSITLGIVTLIGFFLFIYNFVDKKTSYIVLFLLAISSRFIFWDQLPWAPSLFLISQIILLSGAYLSNKNKWGYPLMSLGLASGFQSHFGIFLSLLSILIYLIMVKPVKLNLKMFVLSAAIIIVGFLPNFVFDITHNFTNVKKLVNVLQDNGVEYFVSFNKIINVLSANTISAIYPRDASFVDKILTKSLFALVLVNTISLLRDKKYKNMALLLLATAIIPAVVFFIQQGKFSEYYLVMTVPSLIVMMSLLIKKVVNKKVILAIMLVTAISLNIPEIKNKYVIWNLKAKEDVAKEMIRLAGVDDYGISLTTSLGNNFGFKYVLDYYGIKAKLPPEKGETRIFSIIIPEGFDGMVGMKDYSGIGLRWSGI